MTVYGVYNDTLSAKQVPLEPTGRYYQRMAIMPDSGKGVDPNVAHANMRLELVPSYMGSKIGS